MDFFTQVVALSAIAVVVIQQILKLRAIPVAFANLYPVPTLIVLSIISSVFVVWTHKVHPPVAWTDWVLLSSTTGVVAAITYNNTLRNWKQLREMEGVG